jgi:DNA-binding HxlR family transcriptional regulator
LSVLIRLESTNPKARPRYAMRWTVSEREAEEIFQMLKAWWNDKAVGMHKVDADRVNR